MSAAAGEPLTQETIESPPEVRGAVRVRPRVIEKAVREAAAQTLAAPRGDVSVDITEWGGGLNVRVATKVPIPALDDTEAILAEPTILERMRAAQAALVEELSRLTGREIHRVSVTVTGANIPERKRVR